MVDHVGPPGRRLSGTEVLVPGEVQSEPAGEVVAPPRVGEPGLEEGLRDLVDLEHAFSGDGGGVPLVGPLVHEPDVGVGRLERGDAEVADVCAQPQVALDVLLLVLIVGCRRGHVDRVDQVGAVGLEVVRERPFDAVGVVDQRGRVGLDAVPYVHRRVVEVVVVLVLVGDHYNTPAPAQVPATPGHPGHHLQRPPQGRTVRAATARDP